ncbi:response regulator transcription factor [Flavobacterium sp. xlx-214]|uniref:response regulator n=1 Tax=unclassified Flavobacterium TaxID=196869 RepID=UPI0013D6F43D|nr:MULTISPECIES: response regulator transcription factor [unclassified Flavobacterium]MBA5792079.1 response regulator transcription factor [Flavobacterium sp. xlx-221]QMI84326.1 response regulator transcription factor [Flavobacterium sp. xlx-214]
MKNKLNVIVADDHRVITKAVSFIVKNTYNEAEVTEVNKLEDVLKKIKSLEVDLLIMDVSFPEGNSLAIIPTIKALQPTIKILIFSGLDEDIYAIRYINTGANGYLSKLSSEEDITNAIISVVNTGKYLSKNVQDKIMDSVILKKSNNPLQNLSNREFEIAQLIVNGYGNTEICSTLDLQKSTVSTYKNRIFEKLQVNTLPELIQLFNLYKDN